MTATTLDATPIFVGQAIDRSLSLSFPCTGDRLEVHPQHVDQFAKIADERPIRKSELAQLRNVPEDKIKNALAAIIGESNIPDHWSGETSDLTTSLLSINGQRVTSAFLLKGPARFHEMQIADLGARGNQIDRLFREPAELLVLQHCHYVRSDVRSMMRAYANQVNNTRKFCIIDGPLTLQILRAYGQCGFSSRKRSPPRVQSEDDYYD